MTALQEIENVKGEETYTRNGADEMSWKSEGKDIYYQEAVPQSETSGKCQDYLSA